MSPQEKQSLKALWVSLLAYYGKQVSDEVLLMYVEDLDGLEFSKICDAMKSYRRNGKNRSAPLPAQIREIVQPGEDFEQLEEDEAHLAVSNISKALRQFGREYPVSARNFIGELGWEIVESNGGWWALSMLDDEQLAFAIPRWKKLAQAIARKDRKNEEFIGIEDQAEQKFNSISELLASRPKSLLS